MEWQAIVFAMQIMLLATGWVLFQKARADLSARAAETPVLNEVKSLQRNVKQLLAEIEKAADQTSARLEVRIEEGRDLLVRLDTLLENAVQSEERLKQALASVVVPSVPATAPAPVVPPVAVLPPVRASLSEVVAVEQAVVVRRNEEPTTPTRQETRRIAVYDLADTGATPAEIAQQTELSEGEVETLLSLRPRRVIAL